MSGNVSKEIEDEANSYFQRIYNHPPHPTLSIDEVLEMLKKFQDSPNKRERVCLKILAVLLRVAILSILRQKGKQLERS